MLSSHPGNTEKSGPFARLWDVTLARPTDSIHAEVLSRITNTPQENAGKKIVCLSHVLDYSVEATSPVDVTSMKHIFPQSPEP